MLVTRSWRRPMALLPTGVGVWLCTVALGMLLRVVSGQGTAFAFILVALDITAWAAKRTACYDLPHWRSTVTPGTDSGRPTAGHPVRAMLVAWTPI